jgi:hypothetical protein
MNAYIFHIVLSILYEILKDRTGLCSNTNNRRNRTIFGQGLDLYDIDIGKKQFGFKRAITSSPLEPVYTYENQDSLHKSKCFAIHECAGQVFAVSSTVFS